MKVLTPGGGSRITRQDFKNVEVQPLPFERSDIEQNIQYVCIRITP